MDPFLAELSTPRLKLLCLQPCHLQSLLDDPAVFEREVGFPVTRDSLTPTTHRALRMKVKKMESAERRDYPWFSYWLIWVRETRFGAGLIGFKGIPAGPSDVEIGYGIDPACQNRGYTTEAVRALADWAFNEPRCTGIFANVLKTNPASSKVLEKAGFACVSAVHDSVYWRLGR